MYEELELKGFKPKLHILDNEASASLKRQITKAKTNYQLVEPHNHRVLAAERCIRTFKNHFIAGLATTDPNFPFYLWDKLLNQAQISINLLRNSRQNPQISAYTHIWGNYNFNKTPLAPPGTKAVIFEDPDIRASWGPYGKTAWYIGPALEHYRNFTFYINETGGIRTSASAQFFPHQLAMPKITSTDALTIAANDLVEILKDSKTNLNLYLQPEYYSALKQITKIFNTASKQPPIELKPPATPELKLSPKETETETQRKEVTFIKTKPTKILTPLSKKLLYPTKATKYISTTIQGDMHVGDQCWRQVMLVTRIRCW